MTSTNKFKLPLPSDSDRVRNGASEIRTLSRQTEKALDSDITQQGGLLQLNGWDNIHGRISRNGKLVTAFIDISRTGSTFVASYSTFSQIATIPTEFRPDRDTWAGFVQIRSGGDIALVKAGRDGKLQLYPQGKSMKIATSAAITGVLTWQI